LLGSVREGLGVGGFSADFAPITSIRNEFAVIAENGLAMTPLSLDFNHQLEGGMEERRRTRYFRLAIVLLAQFAVVLHLASAQQMPPPTLDEILLRLEGNLNHYDKQVPNFFCSEHVVSSLSYGKNHQSTSTDSVFRVERTSSGALTELREIKAVNGSPANGENVGGPAILSGVFKGGLDAVSLRQKACMSYTLQPIEPGRSDEPYIIQFTTLPNTQRRSECVLREEGVGRVFIDPTTTQVTRMELRVANHVINPGEVGVWYISINYAPILFVGQTFWMPTTLTSTATPSDVYTPTVYSFSARYTDYHKLDVTSHIVPP
jgi:hypothetical protein